MRNETIIHSYYWQSILGAWILVWVTLIPQVTQAQTSINLDEAFKRQWAYPEVIADESKRLTIDSLIHLTDVGKLPAASPTPHLSLGYKLSDFWAHFTVHNPSPKRKLMIVHIERKDISRVHLWRRDSTGVAHDLTTVGHPEHNDIRYRFMTGFDFLIIVSPGKNDYWAKINNDFSSINYSFRVFTMHEYSIYCRQTVCLFGLFYGILIVALLATIILYWNYRQLVYLFYFLYLMSIFVRESYNYSMDLGMVSLLGRRCIVISTGLFSIWFMSYLLKFESTSPRFYIIVKTYTIFSVSLLFLLFLAGYQHDLKLINQLILTSHFSNGILLITLILMFFSMFRVKSHALMAFMAFVAYFPTLIIFALGILRNMLVVSDIPHLQQISMFGFIFEGMVFTAILARQFRNIERDRQVLNLEIEVETQGKEFAVLQAEKYLKDRIARNLHTDVARSLYGIGMLSKVAYDQITPTMPAAAPMLERINKTIGSATDSINELIWMVRPGKDYMNDMAEYMREYAIKMLEASGIHYTLNIPRKLPEIELDLESRRNIYLIFKEAINNAVKHSHCKNMIIVLNVDRKMFKLKIEDDGQGFEIDQSSKGYGLNNMIKRAEDIGATFEISTGINLGTSVWLSKPLDTQI